MNQQLENSVHHLVNKKMMATTATSIVLLLSILACSEQIHTPSPGIVGGFGEDIYFCA